MIKGLLIWFLITLSLHAQNALFHESESYSLTNKIDYYEDVHGELNWQQANQKTFRHYPKENINFGFTKSVYWFKINLSTDFNPTAKQWWLMVTYPLLDFIDLYVIDAQGMLINHNSFGASVHKREFPMRNFVTQLSVPNPTHNTLLLRVQTQSSMQVPLLITSNKEIFNIIETGDLRIGLYYGIFLIIFLYNLVIYFYTKDHNYLRYMLFLSAFILWQLSFDGVGREYIWNHYQELAQQLSAVFISFTAFTALYFSRNFLSTKNYLPTMDKFIMLLMGLSGFLCLLSLFVSYSSIIAYNAALVGIVPLVLLVSGIKVMRLGYRPARFYVLGWSSFLVGSVVFAFNKFDLIPTFYGVNHVQQIGSAVEMIFLSWALADRVHLLQKEYIEKLNQLNDILSDKVKNALIEARQKDRLFVQQSKFAAMGEMIEQIAHQWRQPLNTLSLINQNLYFKRELGECSHRDYEESHEQFQENLQYMSKTIDDFRNYYKMDKPKESVDIEEIAKIALRLSSVLLNDAKIKTHIKSHTSTHVILSKNEMIQVFMNLIKNAHDAIVERSIASAEINISVLENEEFLEIWVEDNAGGIDPYIIDKLFLIYFTTKPTNQGTGLGLHMCRYIVEESFGGTISVENGEKGARFIIRIPLKQKTKESDDE